MLGKAISAMVVIMITMFAIVIAQGMVQDIPPDASSVTKAMASNLGPVIGIVGIIAAFVAIFGAAEVAKYIKYKKWDDFGNRMKAAYEAKFGYRNPAFDKEVEQHVLAMKSLGKGYTKDIDEDWMKRMAKFVEVPWAIPEEERLSETEKTEEFSDRN